MIQPQQTIDGLSVAATAAPEDVVGSLRRNGIAIVPGFVGGSALDGLLDEHRLILEDCARAGRTSPGRNALGVREGKWCSANCPAIHRVFFTEWARAVVTGYLGPKCAFNEAVFCTHEREPLKPITAPHFDIAPSLKLFVYLTDTHERNGAFRYAPGTHVANAAEALRWREAGGRVVDTPNVAHPEEAARILPFEGSAGTLLIFDSNGFHSGGTLQPGEERRVIRVQSYPWPRLRAVPRRFSWQWFCDTHWNPLNRLRPRPVATRASTEGTSIVIKPKAR